MIDYLITISWGISSSLLLTAGSLLIAFTLAVIFTLILASYEKSIASVLIKGYVTLFTGTPLLIQLFLIYSGPGQFEWIVQSPLWVILGNPWLCALIALALNSAAYSTQLFYGAIKATAQGMWESATALGLTRYQSMSIIIPFALKRSIAAYSNEIVLVFKGTSLVSTIAVLDIMGYARQLYGIHYDAIGIYGMAGVIYLIITGIMILILRRVEKTMLAFEQTKG